MSSCCPPNKPSGDQSADQAAEDGCHPKTKIDYLLYGSLAIVAGAYLWTLANAAGLVPAIGIEKFCRSAYELMNRMWIGILIGFVFVGLLNRVPKEFVIAALGTSKGFKGIFRATLAGLGFDLCNHGILMVGMKLYERGANLGQVMAFLIASPWNSLSLTVILMALIGWQWTLLFIVASGAIALLSGLIFNALVARGHLPENPHSTDLPADFRFWRETKSRLKQQEWQLKMIPQIVYDGMKDSRMILRWLLFGVVLTALIQSLVSAEHMQQYFGPSLLGLVLTLVATTVIEVCSEGSTPIAADIFHRASAPGNAFTFLMAGVATDYTEILVVKDTMKSWKVAFFIPLVTVPQVLTLGWLFNHFGS